MLISEMPVVESTVCNFSTSGSSAEVLESWSRGEFVFFWGGNAETPSRPPMSRVLANVPDVGDSTERACFVSSHFKASNRLRRFSNSDLRVGNSWNNLYETIYN